MLPVATTMQVPAFARKKGCFHSVGLNSVAPGFIFSCLHAKISAMGIDIARIIRNLQGHFCDVCF